MAVMVSVGHMAVCFLFIDVCIFINIFMFSLSRRWTQFCLYSTVSTVTGLQDESSISGSFLFSVESGVALGHTQPRMQYTPRALSRATHNQECVEPYLPFPIQFYNFAVN
jgi:hypothetical protein